MAHELEQNDHIVYNSKSGKPWHELGIPLPGLGTSMEVMNAMPEANQDILKVPQVNCRIITDAFNSGKPITPAMLEPVEGLFQTVTQNTNRVLGSVGSKYVPLQNRDALSVIDNLTKDPNGPKYETAGILQGGRKFWALAKIPGYITVANQDVTNLFILISNSHDGSSAIDLRLTPIRVVCNNTLTWALNSKEQKYLKVRHTVGAKPKLIDEGKTLGLIMEAGPKIQTLYDAMANTNPTQAQLEDVLKRLIPDTKSKRDEVQRERILDKYNGNMIGYDMAGGKNAWSLYNAYTELTTHDNTANFDDDKKLRTILFGGAVKANSDGLNIIAEIMGLEELLPA